MNLVSKKTLIKYLQEYKTQYPERIINPDDGKCLYPDEILDFINEKKSNIKNVRISNLLKHTTKINKALAIPYSDNTSDKESNLKLMNDKYIVEITNLNHEITELKRMVNAGNDKISSLKAENNELNKIIMANKEEILRLKNDVIRLDTLSQQYRERAEHYRKEMDKLLKLNEYLETLKSQEEELNGFKLYNEKCEKQIYSLEKEVKKKNLIVKTSMIINIILILFFLLLFFL